MDIREFCCRVRSIEKELEKVQERCKKDQDVIKTLFSRVSDSFDDEKLQESPETILNELVSKWREKSVGLSFEPKEEFISSETKYSENSYNPSLIKKYYEDDEEIIEGPEEFESIQGDPLCDWPYKDPKDYKSINPTFDPDSHFFHRNLHTPQGKGIKVINSRLFGKKLS